MTAVPYQGFIPAIENDALFPEDPDNPGTDRAFEDDINSGVNNQIVGLQQRAYLGLGSVAGTADAITASTVFATNIPPGLTTLSEENRFRLVPALSNTGAVTIAIDNVVAKAIKANNGDDLPAGYLQPGSSYDIVYTAGGYFVVTDVGSTLLAGNRAPDDIFECRRAAGTGDGTSTAATADDRTINTTIKNTRCTLSSSQITIPAGKSRVRIAVPFWGSGLGRGQLYNVTDAAIATDQNGNTVVGTVVDSGTAGSAVSWIDTILDLASSKTFKVQSIVVSGVANGLGKAANLASGQEVFTRVEITRIDETNDDFAGEPGGALTEEFEFDDATSGAAPVAGQIAFNNASFASATSAVVSKTSATGRTIAGMLASLGAGTSTKKADLELYAKDDRTQFVRFAVSAFTDRTSHYELTLAKIEETGDVDNFTDGDALIGCFTRVGDAGATSTLTTIVTPTAFSATTNDLDTGSAGRQVIKVSTDGTARSWTGLIKKATGEHLVIENIDSAKAVTMEDAHASSSAANRFNFGRDIILKPKDAVRIRYDEDTSNWKLVSISYPTSEWDAPEETVASAATADIGAATAVRVAISGTTGVTSFGTTAEKTRFLRFTGTGLTITYNATSMITLTGKDRVVRADDTAVWTSDASGNWRERSFMAATLLPGKNYVDNPSLNNWQRATSFTVASSTRTALADRWKGYRAATGMTVSRQTGFAVTGSSSSPKYCMRIARDNGTSSTAVMRTWHQLHEFVARGLAGQYVTLSFDIRAGANYSGGALSVRIHTGTAGGEAVDLSLQSAAAFATGGDQSVVSSTVTPTTTAQRVNCTPRLLGSSIADLALQLSWTPSGTAGAADYIEITNVKLEIGAVATPFQPPDEAADFAACQYTFRFMQPMILGAAASATTMWWRTALSPAMRVAPTASVNVTGPTAIRGSTTASATGMTITAISTLSYTDGIALLTTGWSGLTTDAVYFLQDQFVFKLDAELLA